MKLPVLIALSLQMSTLAALAADKSTGTWSINPRQSKMSFIAFRSGRIPATGHFSDISGKINYDGRNLKAAGVVAKVPLSTIQTGIAKRNSDLKGPKYFDIKNFANASFTSRAIKETDEKRLILAGELEIHGIKKSVDLAMDPPVISGPKGKEHLQAKAATILCPLDFGLDLKKLHPDGYVKVDLLEVQLDISADKDQN